jgi:hypothetical protein
MFIGVICLRFTRVPSHPVPSSQEVAVTVSYRPMFSLLTRQLENEFLGCSDDVGRLEALATELTYRRRVRARRLAAKVSAALEGIRATVVAFPWPSTAAIGGDATLSADFQERGALSAFGYCVGKAGLPARDRRLILDRAYSGPMPRDLTAEYLEEWATPESDLRLRKLAHTLATLTRNAKRRKLGRCTAAIAQWEADLAYLKATYYEGRWHFPWPSTRAA